MAFSIRGSLQPISRLILITAINVEIRRLKIKKVRNYKKRHVCPIDEKEISLYNIIIIKSDC